MSYARGILLTALAALAFITLLITSPSLDAQGGARAGAQANAQATRTVQDGVFSDAQAARGQTLYTQRCAGCHGPALAGAQGPALVGERFTNRFRMEPLSALFIQIRYAMPPKAEDAAKPTSEQAADLVAYILKSNGFPAGKTDFPAMDAVNSKIEWPAGRGIGAGSAPASSWYAPTGNLAQLMRAVFFHNSNMIFAIQEVEKAEDLPPPPPSTRPDGLTTFDTGLLLYTGWQVVENAATALADASVLMMQPGLRCENGRAAPITEPDWITFTDRMVSIARRTHRLAQTRNKDAVAEFTLDLSNACNACHRTYRDIGGRGRGLAALGDTSARCMHR